MQGAAHDAFTRGAAQHTVGCGGRWLYSAFLYRCARAGFVPTLRLRHCAGRRFVSNETERGRPYRVHTAFQRGMAYSFRRFRGAFRGFATGRSAFSFSVGTGRCRLRGRYPSGAVRTGRRSATVREKNSFEAIRFSCRCESGCYVKEGRIPCPAGTWRETNGRASRCRWLTVRFGNETGRSCHFFISC